MPLRCCGATQQRRQREREWALAIYSPSTHTHPTKSGCCLCPRALCAYATDSLALAADLINDLFNVSNGSRVVIYFLFYFLLLPHPRDACLHDPVLPNVRSRARCALRAGTASTASLPEAEICRLKKKKRGTRRRGGGGKSYGNFLANQTRVFKRKRRGGGVGE